MCGRYALGRRHADIQALDGYNVHVAEWINPNRFIPRYNIAPRSNAPVVRRMVATPAPEQSTSSSPSVESDELVMHTMRWGLVPHWSKREDKSLSTTNARAENLVEGHGMWNSIKGKKRCVVPCDGYYEWLKKGKERLPHFTRREDGKLMLLAGLYDCATLEGESEPLWTFTIVTTAANSEFSWLHDRQPVILSSHDAVVRWLDTSSQTWTKELTDLVRPYHDEFVPLTCYQVPKEVGKVGTESPTFIQPITERKDGIQAMFAKQSAQGAKSSQPGSQYKAPKRSRSPSPNGQDKSQTLENTPKKKVRVEKMDTWEDNPDIEYLDEPPSSQPVSANLRMSKTYSLTVVLN
ncbi:DUF159-domain-containing protein [Panus rudis PR-1116 ss-1]|nr:DUF159-domain-containing protein [Panus rudis PR-1116 ss-1]